MKIEVQQQPEHQDGVPGSVHLLLRGSDGSLKGCVSVVAVKDPIVSEAPEEFRVEVVGGAGAISGQVDFKVKL